MTYPGGSSGQAGESVSYGYTAGWLPNTVGGSSPYLQSATYDAAGRPELLTLGNNALKLDTVYHPWTAQGGRLAQIKAGTPSNLTSLQDLRYSYDAVGNVLKLDDYKAGSPQAQTFGYDAAALGGGARQAGTRPTKPHALDTAGSPAVVDFNCDCNGNVTTRVTPAPSAGAVPAARPTRWATAS